MLKFLAKRSYEHTCKYKCSYSFMLYHPTHHDIRCLTGGHRQTLDYGVLFSTLQDLDGSLVEYHLFLGPCDGNIEEVPLINRTFH